MNGGTPVKVGDSLEKIPRQAKVMKSAYQADGAIPVIDQGKDYIAGYTDAPELRYNGPLPLTIFGDHTRILKWVDKPFAVGADGTQLLRGDERFDQRYFYYALCNLELEHFGYERHFKYLKEEEIPCPDLPTQRRIAGILSAYDDLIENNLRRIRILEEMAQSLYREWFVHFRFPGHEGVKMVDSPLGSIPEGWSVVDLAAVCIKNKGIQTGPFGSQLHESDYSEEGVPVVMPKDLIGFRVRTESIARIPEETADNLARHRMQLGDIVYGRRGDIGRRAFIMPHQIGWFCGTGCLRLRPESDAVNGWFLFNYLGQDNVANLIAGRAQGVTMPNLNTGILSSVPVTLPPRKLQEHFARLSFPFAEARESLHAAIQTLRQTRDLLLPKLLSA